MDTTTQLATHPITGIERRGLILDSADELKDKALEVRRDIITMLAEAGSGHSGGPLSITDFGTALYFNELNVDPTDPTWTDRDFVVWSVGHCTPVHYSLLAEKGFFPKRDLLKFRKIDGHLQGHPHRLDTPGVEVSTGSLGQGISVACGIAYGSKMDGHKRRVWSFNGDGEQQEGSVWEAAMFAAHYKLDNLVSLIDFNYKQIDGDVVDIMNIESLADKYRAFNWNVLECNGHKWSEITEAYKEAGKLYTSGRPTAIIFHTVMGQGISYMAGLAEWHGKPPKGEQVDIALKELGTTEAEWRAHLEANQGE
jgi:transketolase